MDYDKKFKNTSRMVPEIMIRNFCPDSVVICIRECKKCWIENIKEEVKNG